ncbi:hypothetical protein HRI_003778700 [Hibiscus trionum]|uniref:GAG-pre-integrase domain-containing protein n=1 Tax=Hibiscus trionum TaxID=183268 RepID=A0A9W7IS40_HIBTR|nr:hypothetical protein HRI_003778700 [Hibiscus trionum]
MQGLENDGLYKLPSAASASGLQVSTLDVASKDLFFPDECILQSGVTSSSSLEALEITKDSHTTCFVSVLDSLELWHRRLGHQSSVVLDFISKNCNISFHGNKDNFFCEACKLGKSHKLKFISSLIVYNQPLQLIQIDLWGPAPLLSNNYRYYISFADAYSRYT